MEKNIIYIAGNPDIYPIEYYDRDTQSYQGVVPELMRRFSEQSRYDVRYYSPGKQDQRKALAILMLVITMAAIIIYSRRKLGKLRRSKEIDPVTGLGDREHLERYYRAYLNDRNRVLYSMLCFCCDSDALAGGRESAALLRHIAVVLRDCASDTDITARVSDNGFAMLRLSSEGQALEEWLTTVLNRIWEGADQPGCSRARDVTAGVCQLKLDDRDLDEIIFRSIRSAQAARQMGTGYQFFSGEAQQKTKEEQRLRADGARSLQNREFQLYLQFYAEAQTGRAVGAEAFLFWEHPDWGLLLPERYLPILEREGLAEQLDDYLLDQACAFLDSLQRGGREDFFLLCRLSAKTVASENLAARWGEIIGTRRLDRRMLMFSVPREAAFGGRELSAHNLEAVLEMGMRLILEGFDGQAEDLALAQDAQFSGLKLNGDLAGRLDTPGGQVVLASILRAGHQLGLAFLAEDVETEGRSACLRKLGCDLLRGALYARPLPVWEAAKKLTGRHLRKERL